MKIPEFGFFKSFNAASAICSTTVGCWKLQKNKAISLYPVQDSLLTIKQGKVWATLNTGSEKRADDYGDHFLSAGNSLLAHKGQHLVLESVKGDLPVFFDFTPF